MIGVLGDALRIPVLGSKFATTSQFRIFQHRDRATGDVVARRLSRENRSLTCKRAIRTGAAESQCSAIFPLWVLPAGQCWGRWFPERQPTVHCGWRFHTRTRLSARPSFTHPMRTSRLDWLRAGGHSFHPVYEVCGVCGMTRPQYQNNGKPKCTGRQSEFERFIEPDDVPDLKGG
jgi:hypothetical protein